MGFYRMALVAGLALTGSTMALSAASVHHGRLIRPRGMAVQTDGSLSVEFAPLPDSPRMLAAKGVAVLDLGNVSYAARSRKGVEIARRAGTFEVATPVGMRVGPTGLPGGTVSLKAWLAAPADPYRVYLDGVELNAQPVCVDTAMPIGTLTRHQLKIRVPKRALGEQAKLQAVISLQAVLN